MTHIIKQFLSHPPYVIAFSALICAVALVSALVAEAFFGLEPCIMCIYQRIPFALILAEALLYFSIRHKNWMPQYWLNLGVLVDAVIIYLINVGLAIYHTGIEQKWWASFEEGCSVPPLGDDPKTILQNILSAPTGRCDEIAWADPILHLSMANWNIILCAGMAVICGVATYLRYAKRA